MAFKRTFTSIPSLARLASSAATRAPAARSLLRLQSTRQRLPVSVSIPSTTIRLAHGIPRPRNPSPFQQNQQQQQPEPTTATTPPPSPPSSTSESPSLNNSSTAQQPAKPNVAQQPHYELTFTCRPCGSRSRHRVSKQGYHHGSILIACPGCTNRHVISDHLRIFGDTAMTIEDILRDKGELVKKGTLGEEGDLEFWDDGTSTPREPWEERAAEKNGEEKEDLPPGATFKSVRPGEKGKQEE